jgi:hypothetical protein
VREWKISLQQWNFLSVDLVTSGSVEWNETNEIKFYIKNTRKCSNSIKSLVKISIIEFQNLPMPSPDIKDAWPDYFSLVNSKNCMFYVK